MNQSNCPICSMPATIIHNMDHTQKFNLCPNCEFIQKTNSVWPVPEEEKARYLTHKQSLSDEGYVKFLSTFISFAIFPHLNKINTVLDFGCGHGPVLVRLLEKEGLATVGYDSYFYPNEDVFTKTYDCITSVEVFEHLQNPLKEMETLTACIKPSGILAIQTNFHNNHIPKFLEWWYIRDNTHISFYSIRTIEIICQNLKYKLLKHNNKNICVLEKL